MPITSACSTAATARPVRSTGTALLVIGLLAAGALQSTSLAANTGNGLRYSYLEGGYRTLDLDSPNADGDGLYLGGSFAATEYLFVSAEWSDLGLNRGVDVRTWELGLGFNMPLTDRLDLVVRGGYTDPRVRTRFGNFDDDGYFAAGGIRTMVTEVIELNGALKFVDRDVTGSDTVLELGAQLQVSPTLDIGMEIEIGDEANQFSFGLRYHLPRR